MLGQPPSIMQIFMALKLFMSSAQAINNLEILTGLAESMLREDLVMVDKNWCKWSTRRHEGFHTYTEWMKKRFGENS